VAISKGTFVAYSGADGAATSVTSSAFDSTGAGLLIAIAGWEDGDSSGLTFSDNVWQTAVVEDGGAGADPHSAMCWCVPTDKDAAHTVTCNFGASVVFRRIAVLPVVGNFSSIDALIATTQTLFSTHASSADAGTLTTSDAAILVQSVIDYNGRTGTAGSGWTKDSATTGRHFQSRVEASGGTFDPALGLSAAALEQFSTIAMAFKEAGPLAATRIPFSGYIPRRGRYPL
jgi:hypothetical protein